MTTTYIDELRVKRKELRARFFPNQAPKQLVPPAPLAPPPTLKPDAPVVKHFHVPPEMEPMEAEEFGAKMRQGEFARSEANFRRLIQKLAEEHGFTYDDIVGVARQAKLVDARFHVYWYLAVKMKVPNFRVGHMLNKDHTSVRYGRDKWQAKLDAERRK